MSDALAKLRKAGKTFAAQARMQGRVEDKNAYLKSLGGQAAGVMPSPKAAMMLSWTVWSMPRSSTAKLRQCTQK
jgi:hypothetical protein